MPLGLLCKLSWAWEERELSSSCFSALLSVKGSLIKFCCCRKVLLLSEEHGLLFACLLMDLKFSIQIQDRQNFWLLDKIQAALVVSFQRIRLFACSSKYPSCSPKWHSLWFLMFFYCSLHCKDFHCKNYRYSLYQFSYCSFNAFLKVI